MHSHFSSLIDYRQIFDDLKELKLDRYLQYNLFKNELYFNFENKSDIEYYKNEEDVLKLI